MRLRSVVLNIVKIFGVVFIGIALLASPRSFAAEQASDVPAWLRAHVGQAEGQIAQVVLQRARALYFQKVREGVVRNPCYFAMDATRPNDLSDGKLGDRFYVICESDRSFRAISAGHGGGRDLKGIVDFANGRRCAKNFGNAMDSKLTAGGAYVTGETSFKGYYRVSAKQDAVLLRSFVQFDGEGQTANVASRTERSPHRPRRGCADLFEDRRYSTIRPHARRSRAVWRAGTIHRTEVSLDRYSVVGLPLTLRSERRRMVT